MNDPQNGIIKAMGLKTENAWLRQTLEDIRANWQAECDRPSGRMEDRRIFYDTFADDGPLGSGGPPGEPDDKT